MIGLLRRLVLRASVVSAAGVFGCGVAPATTEESAAQQAEIVYGEPSPEGTPDDAVVLVRAEAERAVNCTGTLVAPNLVLTGRHCIAYTGPENFSCNIKGERIESAPGGGVLGADFPATAIAIYGSHAPRTEPIARVSAVISSLSDNVCLNDIAFLVLDRHLDLPVLPIRIRLPTRRGELATLIGYGTDGTASDPGWDQRPRRRTTGRKVADVGPDSLQDGVTTMRPRVLLFERPSGCFGDSGGPAVSETTGVVFGVFSTLGGGDCRDERITLHYTHTSPFEALALKAFAAAGAEPHFEDDRTLGDSCIGNHQCASGRCIANPSGTRSCSQLCDVSPCPDGFSCQALGADKLCMALPSCAEGQRLSADSSACEPVRAAAQPTSQGCSLAVGKCSSTSFALLVAALALLARRAPKNEEKLT